MSDYTRIFLHFLHALTEQRRRVSTFLFGTRLTNITRQLKSRDPEVAFQMVAHIVPDWSGGTRIGEALKSFNDRFARRGLARGAVLVVLSDGWEVGDPALVAREMERLARLARRIVWVNPRAAASGFAPLAGGMAAALPFCDALQEIDERQIGSTGIGGEAWRVDAEVGRLELCRGIDLPSKEAGTQRTPRNEADAQFLARGKHPVLLDVARPQ